MNCFATEGDFSYSITRVENGWIVKHYTLNAMRFGEGCRWPTWVFSAAVALAIFLGTHVRQACTDALSEKASK
jgi:hypothetical protein